MQEKLTYLTPEGNTVFTSQFLKNRKTCCKTACLHCPYGHTLKKHGLQFKEVSEADFEQVDSIISESSQPVVEWKTFWPEHVRLVLIKEQVCGVILKNNIVIKHLYLRPHFQNQDLSKEMVESYFFI